MSPSDEVMLRSAELMFSLSTLIDDIRLLSPEERARLSGGAARAAESTLHGDNKAVFEAVWPMLFERAELPQEE